MTWVRLQVLSAAKGGAVLGERVFNLTQVQWWIGHGTVCELQFTGALPVYVDISDKRMEILTGASGHYAND